MGEITLKAVRQALSRRSKSQVSDPSLAPAGVLVLLYPKNGEYCVILNRRSDEVEHHKGEISFPGGRREPQDATLRDTALRETCEEMGVRPEHVELLGELDDRPTSSSFVITPYVGAIEYPYEFIPSRQEVAQVLEVPLSALMDDGSLRDDARLIDGRLVHFPTYVYEGQVIFGATAGVLKGLLELLDGVPLDGVPQEAA
jgi:8-oxo-dGTP pyrophosphatase MutT (NUDIX family)